MAHTGMMIGAEVPVMLFLAILVGPILAALIIRIFMGEEYYWMKRRSPGKYP